MSFVFGLLLQSPFTPDLLKLLGNLGLLLAITAIGYNIYIFVIAPLLHGLSLYLNSGDESIFITENKQLLKRVIMTLREFRENPEKFNYVNIEISKMNGNVVTGDNHGKMECK